MDPKKVWLSHQRAKSVALAVLSVVCLLSTSCCSKSKGGEPTLVWDVGNWDQLDWAPEGTAAASALDASPVADPITRRETKDQGNEEKR